LYPGAHHDLDPALTRGTAGLLLRLGLAVVVTLAGLRALATARGVQLFGRLYSRVHIAEPMVALTFDDGPTTERLDTLLAVLESRGVHATFFVTGRELAAAPDAGRRLVAAGHELGNHTWSHPRMVLMSQATVRSEIERTDTLIRGTGYQGRIRFRPAYGYKLIALPWYLSRQHRTTITWDIEPDSYREVARTSDGIVRHTLERVTPGSIILLHPWYTSRSTSFAAISPLIDSLQARGIRVGTVGALLARASPPLPE